MINEFGNLTGYIRLLLLSLVEYEFVAFGNLVKFIGLVCF